MATNSYNYQEITYICTQTCVNMFNFSFELIGLLLMMTSTLFMGASYLFIHLSNYTKRIRINLNYTELQALVRDSDIMYYTDNFLPKDNHNLKIIKGDIRDKEKIYIPAKLMESKWGWTTLENNWIIEKVKR